jgi:hypothetical protein
MWLSSEGVERAAPVMPDRLAYNYAVPRRTLHFAFGKVISFVLMAIVWGAAPACTGDGVDGRSTQRLGLRLTGLGKSASVELPIERRNTQVTYQFGGTLDVRQPPVPGPADRITTISTYSTEFEPSLFQQFTDAGAFIEDVSFTVSEEPITRCAELAQPRRAATDQRSVDTTATSRTLSGRAWTETVEVTDVTKIHLRRTSHTFSTRLAETDTCLALQIQLIERTAPRGPDDRTKYSRYDPSARAQDANRLMVARAARIAEDAAASFTIK